jgi:NAD(P)-dependent dehydrogenase (short-subunit alcohol dehydrogenase family)
MPQTGLKDKVAIVTGAGSRGDGIGNGRAAAILLAREGAKVALLDAMKEWAEATKAMIDAEGGTSMIVVADVADPVSSAASVKATVDAWAGSTFLSTTSASADPSAMRSMSTLRRGTPPCAST